MEPRWHETYAILVLLWTTTTKVGGIRPETVLRDALTRPFVPHIWASQECLQDAAIYLQELEKYAPWALQMYDASVKIPTGLITGNYKQLGNYDECLRVKSNRGFVGQACHTFVQFNIAENDGKPHESDLGDLLVNVAIASNSTRWTSGKTVLYEWMWCVPSTCNHTEVRDAVEDALDPLKVEGRVDVIVTVPEESCYTAQTATATWSVADFCYTSILVLFAFIIIASTGYDIAVERRLVTNRKALFTAFSLYTNGKSLLQTDRRQNSIDCLDGLRFLSICWIIYGHTYYIEVVGAKMDLTQVPRMHYNWSNMLILNANIVTDTFFLLSGILLAYIELSRERDTNWRFNAIGLYVHRYVRLTPAYAMMIGFYATLFDKLGTGLHWDNWVSVNKNSCQVNWWTNLLYINNYVNVDNICMAQSWYLSADMQLFWLSPLILYPMLKFRKLVFLIILGFGLFLSVLLPFAVTYIHNLTGTILYYKEQEDMVNVYLKIYTRVYNRFGPYVIGLGLGYLLHKTRSRNVKLRAWHATCGWLVTTAAGLSIVFGPRNMYMNPYNRLEASFYAGFHRQVFALAVSWIVFCCVHGYAGPVNHFLSWRGWIPFRKLTYCAYLSHYVFLLSDVGSVRIAGNLTPMNVVRAFFANLVFTLMFSVLWTLCFEIPFMTLDGIFSGRSRHGTAESNICRSKEKPSIVDDKNNTFVGRYNVTGDAGEKCAKENRDNVIEETVQSPVYTISSNDTKVDKWSNNNPDNKEMRYLNFYHFLDERPRTPTGFINQAGSTSEN
ncbi:PREDICTED: nose resistant to fluoxetine protein 6-like isoform X2 [Dinoponera quadriceps]|uniref:Nose resistant to fluoxetine protein 6-like isoform X2 n=1 Tax=Dinoponera quadriceps TaxID=609295 RepID=A0A6P3XHB4_DINQU|nr:PREDICTED: nose resistant to fluoxetine protein 6-like isoform X2 [Dinoponera quadriceps]